MPVATSPSAAAPHPSALVKMEDRKRPATNGEDAPPSKRQAVNGAASKSKDDAGDAKEEAWIAEYTKGAIYRQMSEYKRNTATLEARIKELEKRSAEHDDHVRYIDAWWQQFLDEIELLVDGTVSSLSAIGEPQFESALQFRDSRDFQRQVGENAKAIKSKVESLLNRIASRRGESSESVDHLEATVNSLLANQKELTVKLSRLVSEKEDLSEQLDAASLRYVKAEKKLDRAKSAQVQKLEQQALASAINRPSGEPGTNGGDLTVVNGDNEILRTQYKEATAVVQKQKEQIESLSCEIRSVTEENTSLRAKKEAFTDEDYIRTDVFKQFKAQNEDLIKRINHAEASNKQLREEADKFRAERTSFRTQLEREAQTVTGELEDQIGKMEQDLARIRSARDELFAELTQRKAALDQERHALEHLKELAGAKQDRIEGLESELERLRPGEDVVMTTPRDDLEAMSAEELREKYVKLERNFEALTKDMPSLEKAYKKAMGLANKKVMDFTALEERCQVLLAEKSKADQKYFAARKDMDTRIAEARSLRHQNSRSSEIIENLKEAEAQSRTLISNLEKQLADLKQTNTSLSAENKKFETSSADAVRRSESMKNQVTELTSLVKTKDVSALSAKERVNVQETEIERLNVRIRDTQKDRDTWKAKSLSNSSEEEEALRGLALCTVCKNNFKNRFLKTCGHLFCNECVDSRIANRMRKCPTCNKAFDKVDVMSAHL